MHTKHADFRSGSLGGLLGLLLGISIISVVELVYHCLHAARHILLIHINHANNRHIHTLANLAGHGFNLIDVFKVIFILDKRLLY